MSMNIGICYIRMAFLVCGYVCVFSSYLLGRMILYASSAVSLPYLYTTVAVSSIASSTTKDCSTLVAVPVAGSSSSALPEVSSALPEAAFSTSLDFCLADQGGAA